MSSIVATFVTAFVMVMILVEANYAYADDSSAISEPNASSSSGTGTTDSSSQSSSSSSSTTSESSTSTDAGTGTTVSSDTSSSTRSPDNQPPSNTDNSLSSSATTNTSSNNFQTITASNTTSTNDSTNSNYTTNSDGINSTSDNSTTSTSDNSTNNSNDTGTSIIIFTNDTNASTESSTQTNLANPAQHLIPTLHHLTPKTIMHLVLHKKVAKHNIISAIAPIQLDVLATKTNLVGQVQVEKTPNQTLLGFSGDGYIAKKISSTNNLKRFSLSTWVKPDYTQGSEQFTILSKENAFVLGINNEIKPCKIAQFSIFNGIKWITVQSTTQIDDQKWTHLAVTFDGNTSSIYVNGNLEASTKIEGIPEYSTNGLLVTTPLQEISSRSSLIVGAYQESIRGVTAEDFSGLISDLKIYDLSLDPSSIEKISQTNVPTT